MVEYQLITLLCRIYLCRITCDQTNFTIAVPFRDKQTQTVAKASISRVIYLFGPPRQIVCDETTEFTYF